MVALAEDEGEDEDEEEGFDALTLEAPHSGIIGEAFISGFLSVDFAALIPFY
jgi:hypothetical protein